MASSGTSRPTTNWRLLIMSVFPDRDRGGETGQAEFTIPNILPLRPGACVIGRFACGGQGGTRLLPLSCQRQTEPKSRAAAEFRFEVEGSMVHLQNAVCHGQSDTASRLLGSEIEIED